MGEGEGRGSGQDEPRSKVEAVEKLGNRVAGRLPNLGLLHEGIVEQRHRVLLFFIGAAASLVAVNVLLCGGARDVEAHLNKLVRAGPGLFARTARAAQMAIGAGVVVVGGERKLHGDLVAAGQVRIGNFRVRDLEGGTILHVEGELCLAKVGLAPVPAAQGVLLVLERRAVPVLENLAEALKVLRPDVSAAVLCYATTQKAQRAHSGEGR